ncbi:MAG: ArnT family glycosyltransferase [Thermodesulfobacteriota bacterium]
MKAIEIENDKAKSFFNDRYVWILLIISLSVRIYLSFFTYVIENDSVAFMQIARYFADGDFLSGLRHDYHPLYSFLMTVMYKVIPDMEISGTIVSILFGTLTVIVFYLIGKSVFDRKISFVSSVILALHPYAVRFSADIISESTYFFFFISALGLGFFAITKKKLSLFALTGICSAFAYLTRPEGIGIVIIVASWYVFKDCLKIKAVWKEKLISIFILVISFFIFSSPYLVYIKKETGSWSLTKKKEVSDIAGIGKVLDTLKNGRLVKEYNNTEENSGKKVIKQATARKSNFNIHLKSILYIMNKYLGTLHPLLFIFLIIGVINWTRIKKERFFGLFIASIIVFYLFILYRLNITYIPSYGDIYQYPSRRHLMPLVILAVFFVGIGVYTTGSLVHDKVQFDKLKSGLRGRLRNVWIVQLIILMIIISVLLPKTLKPQRSDKLGIKEVGQWIREHSRKSSPAILSDSARNAYYAGGKHVQMVSINNALSKARAKKVDYILITHSEYRVIEKELLQSVKDKKIAIAYRFPEKNAFNKRSILLYKALY